MTAAPLNQIDSEIVSHTSEFEMLSSALVELDGHPGLQHVRRYPPTGATARRWAQLKPALERMWTGLRWMTSILDAARALRAAPRLDNEKLAELSRLLHERPLTVSEAGSSLDPTAGALDPDAERVGLADTAEYIRSAYPEVSEFVEAVDDISDRTVTGLAPQLKRLDAMRVPAPQEVSDLLALSASDPLSLTAAEVDARIAAISRVVDLLDDWPEALATSAAQLDELRTALQQAAGARAHAERTVQTSPLPLPADSADALHDRLTELSQRPPDASALDALRAMISAALDDARHHEKLATGLLDRHRELHGRLKGYQAKAARLGIGQDPELVASGLIASGLLSRTPCDLRAVTRAVADYQELIAQKRGPT